MESRKLKQHALNDCEARIVECQLHGGCGLSFMFKEKDYHEEHLCIHRKIECMWKSLGCTEVIGPSATRAYHERSMCKFRAIKCPNDCGIPEFVRASPMLLKTHTFQPVKFYDVHVEKLCLARQISCLNGCGTERRVIEMHDHCSYEWGQCPRRKVHCRYGT